MASANEGDRVMAILSAKDGVVHVLGEGVYLGHQIPDEKVGSSGFLARLRDAGVKNPAIKLDNGITVYGAECWWGPVDKVKAKFEGMDLQVVPVEEYRPSKPEGDHGSDTQSL